MLLQPSVSKPPLPLIHNNIHVSLSSIYSSSLSSPSNYSPLLRSVTSHGGSCFVQCSSVSQVHSYGTVDYERKPKLDWSAVYRRIATAKDEDQQKGTWNVLNQIENEGRTLTKWELCRIVKELRKFRRYDRALEVYQWIINRGERYKISTSDIAIQLDLISKEHGISRAEDFFEKLPDSFKDKKVFGALLNAYAHAKMKEKAETLMEEIKILGYAIHALPFNVMMTLYMKVKEYDKVDSVIHEMREKCVPLDSYSYNIWLSSHGARGSVLKMEQVLDQMRQEQNIQPTWSTFSTMAAQLASLNQPEKAEYCLKEVERRITGRDRTPYHFLISLYGNLGKKDEVYRVWNNYKSTFSYIPNMGYLPVISSLIRLSDIEEAEKLYEEWVLVKSGSGYDPRIANLLLSWYVKNDSHEKTMDFFEQISRDGGSPNSTTWEILAESYMRKRWISEALSCFKEAISVVRSKSWRPRPSNVSLFVKICDEEGDTGSKEAFLEALDRFEWKQQDIL